MVVPATSQEMLAVERDMADSADRMALAQDYAVNRKRIERTLDDHPRLADEQREAKRARVAADGWT